MKVIEIGKESDAKMIAGGCGCYCPPNHQWASQQMAVEGDWNGSCMCWCDTGLFTESDMNYGYFFAP